MMTIRASIVESAPYSSQICRKFDMIVGNKEKNTMTSEYQKMIAGEFYRPYGLRTESFGSGFSPETGCL